MSTQGPPRPPATRKSLARFLDLVESTARAVLRRRRLPAREFLEDAIQDGFEGLARAFETYSAEKGARFEAYARPFIAGEILDALDRAHRADPTRVLLRRADAAAADFSEGVEATEEDLASRRASGTATRRSAGVFFSALGFGFAGGIQGLDPEAALSARREHAHALRAVQLGLAGLSTREQRVLWLRTVEGLPWEAVAEKLGCSVITAQRWHRRGQEALEAALVTRAVTGMPPLPDAEPGEA